MKYILYLIIIGLTISCSRYENEDGLVYSEYFIESYLELANIKEIKTYGERVKLLFDGKYIGSNNYPVEFDFYASLYNDLEFKRKKLPSPPAIADTIQSIKIYLFEGGALEDISKYEEIRCYSYYPFLKNSYKGEHYTFVNARLTEIKPEEIILILNYDFYLVFDEGILQEDSEYEIKVTTVSGKELTKRF
ncbi:MAG: hypothetical protein LUF90_06120 [Rikenellaceae bacterium]|nr:hypothetical protein [Rikenellaceae bacterium]